MTPEPVFFVLDHIVMGEEKKAKRETFLVKYKIKEKKISIIRFVEKHIYLKCIYNRSVIYQYS